MNAASQHFEWTILGPDGLPRGGTYTMGPYTPQRIVDDGGYLEPVTDPATGEPVLDDAGEPKMELRTVLPDGCRVGRRLVTYGEWSVPADDRLSPPVELPGAPQTLDELDAAMRARIAAALERFDADEKDRQGRVALVSMEVTDFATMEMIWGDTVRLRRELRDRGF